VSRVALSESRTSIAVHNTTINKLQKITKFRKNTSGMEHYRGPGMGTNTSKNIKPIKSTQLDSDATTTINGIRLISVRDYILDITYDVI